MLTIQIKRSGPGLAAVVEKQIPFAMSRAINAQIKSIQSAVQNGTLERSFTVAPERKTFVRNLVKIRREDFSTKANLIGRVRIEEPEGTRKGRNRAVILTRHEDGGTQTMGSYPLFIPTKHLRPGSRSLVSRKWYPAALRLKDMRGIGGATGKILKGKQKGKRRQIAGASADLKTLKAAGLGGTFILTPKTNPKAWGIYQRVGSGRGGDSLQMLWAFRARTTLSPRLKFYDTSRAVVASEWESTVRFAFEHALRTSR